MPTPDLIQGVDLPVYDDSAKIPDDLATIWYAMIARGIPRFSTAAQRDAAYPAPASGQMCWIEADGAAYVRRGGAWQRLDVAQPSRLIHSSSIGSSAGAAVGGTEVTLWTPGQATNVSTRVEATFSGRISATAANTTAAIKAYSDGTAVAEWHIVIPLAGGPGQTDVTWTTVIALAPGTHQWVVRALTAAGSGTIAALAGCQFTLREA